MNSTVRKNKEVVSFTNTVRVTGDVEENGQIMSSNDALKLAESLDLDLVLVNDKIEPMIVKVIDYSKYLFDMKKASKELAKKQKENNKPVKEVIIGPNIASGDQETKLNQIINFLETGHPVKFVMQFRKFELRNVQVGETTYLSMLEKLINKKYKSNTVPKLVNNRFEVTLTK